MNEVVIFTDGASRGNPGPGGWAFVTVFPNASGEMRVDEKGGREDMTTNNRMELSAVIEGLKHFNGYYSDFSQIKFTIYLDSSYVLKGATEWLQGWKARNWISSQKESVKNQDLWQEMDAAMAGKNIKWKLLPGHSGIYGNERCDEIATAYADGSDAHIYSGSLVQYPGVEKIMNLEINMAAASSKSGSKSGSKSKVPAYSYISAVDGQVMTHKTWDECKKRVTGISGARFKKSISKEDEDSIISEFKS